MLCGRDCMEETYVFIKWKEKHQDPLLLTKIATDVFMSSVHVQHSRLPQY